MNAHRFYIPPEQWNLEDLFLEEGEAHHCVDVLRLNTGARVVVFNGRGMEVTAEIAEVEKGRVSLRGVIKAKTDRLACSITLAQAVPKGKNMDLIVQKATELGVGRITPLLSERTVVHLDNDEIEKKKEKWKQVVIEAAKQSGQNWLPELSSPISAKQFFAMFPEYELPLIASLQTDARSFKKVLANFREQHGRRPYSALMVIGPEGDFTPAEISWAKSAGCIPVSLGPIVLRTETAAIYSLSVLAYELQGPEL
ncbi:MAG: 16S rRNA (uracil(1498)-N(3))-methyltransferase [Verrucomicrobia bacterium]|nr:16S rRNA (uracil(1498)-N(3))-methyltransferase [Verrucomicrobiota bacterium]